MPDLGWLTTLGLAAISAIVEVIRLEGRLNSHDTLFSEREKAVKVYHDELTGRLERIERKLDGLCQANGSTAH